MTAIRLILATGLLLGAGTDPTSLVRRLGAPKFADREAASVEIERLGPEALPALRAARRAKDAEVRSRASALLDRIENDLLVKPTLVALDFHDESLDRVVAALGQRGHASLQLSPTVGPLRSRRITLVEPERVPLWRALDLLGQAAGVELSGGSPAQTFGPFGTRITPLYLIATPIGENPPPSSVSGPFRLTLVGLTHYKERNFGGQGPAPQPMQMGFAGPGMNPGMIPNPGPGAESFTASLQVLAEPRVSVALNGPPRLVEAADDRGNSLLPVSSGGNAFVQASGYSGFDFSNGVALQTTIPLRFPERAGKTIRRLRGVVPLTVTARKDEPLVIPLADAKGRTYHGSDVSLTVHEVRPDANLGQTLIDLSFQPRGDDPEIMRQLMMIRAGGGGQSPLEFVDAQGRTSMQWHMATQAQMGDSVRLTIRLMPATLTGPPTQIRFHELTRVNTEAEFDFQDVAMP